MIYSKLSDDEINKLVGELRYPDAVKVWDFCNNPSDAWPIIVENKISLLEDGGEWEASIDYPCDIGAYGTTEICSKVYEDKNPLRAAMTVYLMMQDEK